MSGRLLAGGGNALLIPSCAMSVLLGGACMLSNGPG